MAEDSKNIDLKFKTTADTSGAKETEKAIKDVGNATKEAKDAARAIDQSDVKIFDTANLDSQEEKLKKLAQAERELAEARKQRTSGKTSGLATDSAALLEESEQLEKISQKSIQAENSIAALTAESKRLKTELNASDIGSENFGRLATKSSLVEKQLREAKDQARAFSAEMDHVEAVSTSVRVSHDNLAKSTNTAATGFKGFGRDVQNASFQLQDIAVQLQGGTSLVRTLGQQLPQLFSGFGPTGAVVGAVLAGAPLIYSFFDTSAEKAKKAKEQNEAYAQSVQDAAEVFEKFSKERREATERGTQNDAKRLADLAKELQDQQALLALETEREKKRIQADGNLALAKERLVLAQIEQRLTTATGESAVLLTKEREQAIQRILDKEREIADQGRAQDAKVAQAKVDAANKALESAKGNENFATKAADDAYAAMKANTEVLNKESQRREALIKSIEAEIEEAKKALENPNRGEAAARVAAGKLSVEELQKQLDAAKQQTEAEAAATGKRDSLEKEFETATKARIAASNAATEAEREHARRVNEQNQLSATQQQDRRIEDAQRQQNQQQDQRNQSENSAVKALGDLATAAQNNPLTADTVAGIKAILDDGKISAEELKKLPDLLQKYQAEIRGTGDRTVTLLSTALDKMEDYKSRISTLEQRIGSL